MASGLALRWPAEALWQRLSPEWPGFSVEVVADIDSTNAELMRRARGPEFPPTVLVAEHQHAGRGRQGRAWHAAPGDGLMVSLGLTLEPQSWSGLSLVVGVVIAETLDPQHHLGLGLKWPNDLWVMRPDGPHKLGGILIETALSGRSPGRVVVGVGLNLQTPQSSSGQPFRTPALGLQDLGQRLSAPDALGLLVPALMAALRSFEQKGWSPWRSRYHARDVLNGQRVSLSDGRQGVALGVDDEGALRLATAQGEVRVHGDEVSLGLHKLSPPNGE